MIGPSKKWLKCIHIFLNQLNVLRWIHRISKLSLNETISQALVICSVCSNPSCWLFLLLFCATRWAPGVLPLATTPPMCPGHLRTCWASSAWYEPATGAPSKSATQRTALLKGRCCRCTAGRTNPHFLLLLYVFLHPILCCWFFKPVELKETVVFSECVRVCVSGRVWNMFDSFYCVFGERCGRPYAWCFSF